MEDGTSYQYDSIYLGLGSGNDKIFAKLGPTSGSQISMIISQAQTYGG